ncbi:LOW QUALITY PROTEIN: hypothetical protein T265_12469 [Opisthorchis viverrini]|uniref:C2H2-type domain-containing protein n=1 Tax=Opisthorchis viverrini TaxID=6198 RepID=A0A075AD31_OPIVI|nr:LOW QUALITY PROTEIN: hypothetical protein T265_12469 [Opisthorchis viverrini]KER33985.1 LOW QUALITY PROTEIN: hypothetical protein T265_12469 [Opisthorchis viverrini]
MAEAVEIAKHPSVNRIEGVELASVWRTVLGYPVGLIRCQLGKILAPVSRPSKEWIGTAVIPYKAGTSEVIRRLLNLANIRLFRKEETLRSVLVQLKDPLAAERTRDCVYKINCNDCAKVYIGQAAKELHTRIGEHKRSINKPPRNAEEYQTLVKDSAMAVHTLETGHRIDLENVEVLRRRMRFTPQRLIAEAVEITKHHSVNRIEGVELASEFCLEISEEIRFKQLENLNHKQSNHTTIYQEHFGDDRQDTTAACHKICPHTDRHAATSIIKTKGDD